MLFVTLLRWLRGSVRFEVMGAFTERFLNLVAAQNIPVWGVLCGEGNVTGWIRAADYRKLRHPAKRAMVRLHIIRKKGLPFRWKKDHGRMGLLLGIVGAGLAVFAMSQCIWDIEITGNERIPTEEVREALSRSGLGMGTLRRAADVRQLQNRMLLELEDLAWIGINLRGSRADIEIRERTMPPPMFLKDGRICNIVAEKDGQIVGMQIQAGQKTVTLGQTVSAGDLLVSGIMEDKTGKITTVHARAKIMAHTLENLEVEVPLQKTVRVRTGNPRKQYCIRLQNRELPLSFWGIPYDAQTEERELSFLGVSFIKKSVYPTEKRTVSLSKEKAKQEALSLLKEEEKLYFCDIKILSRKVSFREKGGRLILKGEYRCEENIAGEREVCAD